MSVTESTGTEFFEQARLSRTKSRDEALDTLQKSLKSAKLTDEEKENLTAQLSSQIDSIAAENEIETLLKAKGFVDCVVFIGEDEIQKGIYTVKNMADGTSSAMTEEELTEYVLNIISENSLPYHGIGRGAILELLRESSVSIGEGKLRDILQALSSKGFIDIHKGRTGSIITNAGRKYLRELSPDSSDDTKRTG